MERSLAHIEIITALNPIDGADKIEVADVLGWKCVVKKGEFKIGEKIVYIEIDSIMPDKPEYEFLRDRKFCIKTIKLRGQISQGLIVPIPEDWNFRYINGTDVTELMGITKYLSPSEKEEFNKQTSAKHWTKNYKITKWLWKYKLFRNFIKPIKQKGFPYWVSKTDEERIQNIPEVLELFKDKTIYITEKIDYQSGTWTGKMVPIFRGILGKIIPIKKYQFVVCSRNMTTDNKDSLCWKIAEKYNIESILRNNPNLTIQGEQGDIKVQGNKYDITEPTMWVFNIIDHERSYHYDYDEMSSFCKKHKLNYVPLVYSKGFVGIKIRLSSLGTSVQDIIEFSKGKSLINHNIPREGIVVRCIENGQKLMSWKCINPEFLLKYD